MKQVLRLQIPMEVASVVHKSQAQKNLFHDCLDLVIGQTVGTSEPLILPHEVQYGTAHVLKDQVHITLHSDDFLQFYNVRVIQSA